MMVLDMDTKALVQFKNVYFIFSDDQMQTNNKNKKNV